jgi:hypothetical protein
MPKRRCGRHDADEEGLENRGTSCLVWSPDRAFGLLSTLDTPQSKSATKSATKSAAHFLNYMSMDGSGCSRARAHSSVWSSPMKSDAPSPNMGNPQGGSAAGMHLMRLSQKDKYPMVIEPDALNISKRQRNRPRFSEDSAMVVICHVTTWSLGYTTLCLRSGEYNLWRGKLSTQFVGHSRT